MILGSFEGSKGHVSEQIITRYHEEQAIGGIAYDHRGIFNESAMVLVEQHLPGLTPSDLDPSSAGLDLTVPSSRVAVAFWGRLDNADALWKKLAPDHRHKSDRHLIALCYKEWGPTAAAHLLGDFVFALADLDKGLCLVVRDQLGARPVFYSQTSAGVYFSSSLGELRALDILSGELDNEWLVSSLSPVHGRSETDATAFADAKRLPPAHALVIDSNGCRIMQYYTFPDEVEATIPQAEQIAKHRALFEQSVCQRLPMNDTGIALELSGGIDSTSIACVIHENARPAVPLHSMSTYDFEEDVSYIGEARACLPRMSHHTLERWLPIENDWHDKYARCAGHPSRITYNMQNAHVMLAAKSNGCSIVFNGAGGDEITTSPAGEIRYQLIHEKRWAEYFATFPGGIITRVAGAGKFTLGSMVRTVLNGGAASVKRSSPNLILSARAWQDYVVQRDTSHLVDRDWKNYNRALLKNRWTSAVHRFESDTLMAQVFGMQSAAPMLDLRLIEHYLKMPLTAKFRADSSRNVHRRAMTGILPENIRLATKHRGRLSDQSQDGHAAVAKRLLEELPAFDQLPDQLGVLISREKYDKQISDMMSHVPEKGANFSILKLGQINNLYQWIKEEI